MSNAPAPERLTPELLRAWAWHRQGLDAPSADDPAAILRNTGWARSVGGANPYLSLRARSGTGRPEVDAAVEAFDLHELPAARGCTYIVPAADYPLALRLAAPGAEASVKVLHKLGVEDAELRSLADAATSALGEAAEPLTPAQLRDVLGDKVRNLGEAGKKKGAQTTLPAVLGRLQADGTIRRVAIEGRLDRQRYAYTSWGLAPDPRPEAEIDAELLARHLRWTGGATRDQTRWFTGLTVARTKAALSALGALEVPTAAGGGPLLLLPEDVEALGAFEPAPTGRVHLLAGTDALFLLRRNPSDFIAVEDVGREGLSEAHALLADLPDHPIVRDGRIVGLWQFDPEAGERGEVAAWVFAEDGGQVRDAVAAIGAWIADELGDFRSFSLDSPASRAKRIAALRDR